MSLWLLVSDALNALNFGGLNPQTLESSLGFAYSFVLSARRRANSVARAFLFRAGTQVYSNRVYIFSR